MEKDLLVSDTLGARRMARKIEYRISVTFSSAPKNVTEILIPVFCDIFIDADGGAKFVFADFAPAKSPETGRRI